MQDSKLSSLRGATDAPDLPRRSHQNSYCRHPQCFEQTSPTHFHDNVQYEESLQNVSNWLPQQYDHPFNDGEDNSDEHLSELLHKVNEALEIRDEFNRGHGTEGRNFEQELVFKINEILKTEEGRTLHVPRDVILQQSEDNCLSRDFTHPHCEDLPWSLDCGDLSHASEAIDDDDCYEDSYRNNGPLMPFMHKYTSSRGNHKRHFDDTTNVSHRGNSYMIMEEQFTGVSLEYWGGYWIDSVEHTLSQSEWLGSPRWQQPLSNQQDWFNNDIQNPNRMLCDNYACM